MGEKRVTDYDLSTVGGVRKAVAYVERLGGLDNENAHGQEDTLHVGVLAAIAAGAETPWALATEALRTTALDFTRWYA